MKYYENIVIGGGLGGLIAAHQLAKNGKEVLLIEKKAYPFHRVCGEYVSNEVKPFLMQQQLFPKELNPSSITQFRLSSIQGNVMDMKLDLGGFGISRYAFDEFLFQKSKEMGVEFLLQTQVEKADYITAEDTFLLTIGNGEKITGKNVIGAFGKRSKLDQSLQRSFFKKRSPFIGVKYHIKTDHEKDIVALHNFEKGYCGINQIENQTFNLCYLGSKEHLKKYGSIAEMEENVLYKNPWLKKIFTNSEFLREKPEVINEINFSPKKCIENHILMIGDAAGLITPLCGNGMAIAIHSGKMAAEAILLGKNRLDIEERYRQKWLPHFKTRLFIGRTLQHLFGAKFASELTLMLMKSSHSIATKIIKNTHGNPF
jgi:menaquinone-9 beta-reductase